MFKGKTVLVTGGTGSIGSEIVRQVLAQSPDVVRVFSRDEAKQYEMQKKLENHDNIRFLLGDVRDEDRLLRAMEDVDIVFHTGALKHVPACEYDPLEAIKTNVIGTQNVIAAALKEKVKKVIFISTDKAVNPINTMGATKLLAEKLITWANFYKKRDAKNKSVFCSVRFGNVIDSRGSVIPLFLKQIENGGPLTITNEKMSRFFISIPQAVRLVFSACELAEGGEVFVLKMPAIRVRNLAEVMVSKFGKAKGSLLGEVQIEDIGVRVGEKLHEDLLTQEELARTEEREDMFIVHPTQSGFSCAPGKIPYSTRTAPKLSHEEIDALLEAEGVSVEDRSQKTSLWAA